MRRMIVVFAFLSLTAASIFGADILERDDIIDAVKKYYQIVDNAKLKYENELQRELANAQKRGDLATYNALDNELKHTIGNNGHSVTTYNPPTQSLRLYKSGLQKTVDNTRSNFKRYLKKQVADLVKDGSIDDARELDLIASTTEPPRTLARKVKQVDIKENNEDFIRRIKTEEEAARNIPTVNNLNFDWKQQLPKARLLQRFVSQGNKSNHAVWSPDGKIIATSVANSYVSLWDVQTGREVLTIKPPQNGYGTGICFTPDGKSILFCNTAGELKRWDLQNQKVTLYSTHGNWKSRVNISPDGKLVCCNDNSNVLVFDVQTGKLLQTLAKHGRVICNVIFSANGDSIISVSQDCTAIVWSTKTWKPVLLLEGHKEAVHGVAVSNDNQLIATGSFDDTVIIWDKESGTPLQKLGGFGGDIVSLAFSPNDSKLAVARNSEGVFILETETWKPIAFIPGHGEMNNKMSWHPDGRRIVTGGNDARLWELPTGRRR